MSDALASALVNAKLGEADGFSSGDGTLDIGFFVQNYDEAKSLINKTLKEAGFDPQNFKIFSLDDGN